VSPDVHGKVRILGLTVIGSGTAAACVTCIVFVSPANATITYPPLELVLVFSEQVIVILPLLNPLGGLNPSQL
jgi:hypothetical protein